CWVAVAADYALGHAFERRLITKRGRLLTAWVFDRAHSLSSAQTCDFIRKRLQALDEHQRGAAIGGFRHTLRREDDVRAVERIRHWIDAGDCYQVNFTFALGGRCLGHPLALHAALRERQPVRYGAYVQHEDGAIVSRSPELFVERRSQRLICRPMKG